jgi:hypothetical protein
MHNKSYPSSYVMLYSLEEGYLILLRNNALLTLKARGFHMWNLVILGRLL